MSCESNDFRNNHCAKPCTNVSCLPAKFLWKAESDGVSCGLNRTLKACVLLNIMCEE